MSGSHTANQKMSVTGIHGWVEELLKNIRLGLTQEQHLFSISELPPAVDQLRLALDPRLSPSEACSILEDLEKLSETAIKVESAESRSVSYQMRWIYSESRLIHSLFLLRNPELVLHVEQWEESVMRLDMAIIIAGAPGYQRLDMILDTIDLIQAIYLPLRESDSILSSLKTSFDASSIGTPGLAPSEIPCVKPPSLSGFHAASSAPFILPGFLKDWPAMNEHNWASASYLLQVAGRARVVPVEIGSDYRTDDWSQRLMSWETFLQRIGILPPETNINSDDVDVQTSLYLAQHNLLTQFPKLRTDIIIPDYVYSPPSLPSSFPSYGPPGNEEQLVINVWLGPKGTISPAHTDPYFNCYCQVTGRKTVWLAPPFQEEMYPFVDPKSRTITGEATSFSLSNTSQVDVFNPDKASFPLFNSVVYPKSMSYVLEPGDLLYIPPGWWHAMRSEDISFSVSMWF